MPGQPACMVPGQYRMLGTEVLPTVSYQKGGSMSEPVVYVNGRLIPASQATVSVFDRGFRMGDGVFDTARTFRHRPYKLREHIERLYRSLYYIRIDPGMTMAEMEAHTLQVVEHNVAFLQPND